MGWGKSPMRILIHDYSGRPPQIEISRELSRRGHDVLYLYAKGNRTPRGALERRSSDPISDSAATHSVPGKVLSHLCAGKPQLAVMPSENYAAQVIRDSGGGEVVVPSDDPATILSTVERLLDDVETRKRMGRNARAYAEKEFDIRRIGDEFEAVIMKACAHRGSAQTR